MNIIGINAYHGDSSACLVQDGRLAAAAEEERFRRIKHWAGFPSEAIRYCLAAAGVRLEDVQHVAINHDPRAHLWKKAAFALRHLPDSRLILDRIRNRWRRAGVAELLEREFPGERFRGELHHVEHHLAHLASAFLVSPFEEAVAVSVDGFGDFASAAWGVGGGEAIDVRRRVYFPHSLGVFYQAMTQYLGFPHYGDEYKVMGLAPYGQPRFLEKMRRIVQRRDDGTFRLDLRYFRHHREKIDYAWENGSPAVGTLYSPELEGLLGPARKKDEPLEQKHKDIARSAQAMYEEVFFHLVNAAQRETGLDALALAGGCAMNSVANGKVYQRTPFKKLYIQSAAGDAGGAIGAAMVAWYRFHTGSLVKDFPLPLKGGGEAGSSRMDLTSIRADERAHTILVRPGGNESEGVSQSPDYARPHPSPLPEGEGVEGVFRQTVSARNGVMDHAYWGPQYSDTYIGEVLGVRSEEIKNQGCRVENIADEGELCRRTAAAVAEGKVVGWFQGRMEWGPRALGNRSIVCDPRRADMKDILNLKIKRRESFRPFAPSILRESVRDWFETDDDVPFMMQVFQIREEKRSVIPAVTHVDGSGRLQTVHKHTNPRYYELISSFEKLTGVPIVLNTSFNENEPVVCRPEEALDCFLRTKMDLLVMENWVVTRRASG
jgi:carbamoyltransferase